MSADQRGSALLLVPTGILIVLILGALAIDTAVIFLAEREAESTSNAAASDLATLAIDVAELRTSGEVRLDLAALDRVEPVLVATVHDRLSGAFVDGSVAVAVEVMSDVEVRVTVTGTAERVIGPLGWLGGDDRRRVHATALGTAALP